MSHKKDLVKQQFFCRMIDGLLVGEDGPFQDRMETNRVNRGTYPLDRSIQVLE